MESVQKRRKIALLDKCQKLLHHVLRGVDNIAPAARHGVAHAVDGAERRSGGWRVLGSRSEARGPKATCVVGECHQREDQVALVFMLSFCYSYHFFNNSTDIYFWLFCI